jgi:hypothetical protein
MLASSAEQQLKGNQMFVAAKDRLARQEKFCGGRGRNGHCFGMH